MSAGSVESSAVICVATVASPPASLRIEGDLERDSRIGLLDEECTPGVGHTLISATRRQRITPSHSRSGEPGLPMFVRIR